MTVKAILNSIPGHLTDKLAEETGVNHSVQRLELYASKLFNVFSSKDKNHKTRHSSIADRLRTMSSDYFAEIFKWSYQHFFTTHGGSKMTKKLVRFDSTMIKISSALVDWGMKVGRKPKDSPRQVQLKVTLGLKGLFPKIVNIHTEQSFLSEENALKKVILDNGSNPEEIISFDLGLKSRKAMQTFDNVSIRFVTKGGDNLRYKVISTQEKLPKEQNGLRFIQDSQVKLYHGSNELFDHVFRLVEAIDIESGERLYFITNINELSAVQIAEIYRHRWDIEVFFRFIKQELNIKHLLSHSINGIETQIYVTLLLAILLTVFKISNKMKGYKIPKLRFEDELLFHIIEQIKQGEKIVSKTQKPVF